jgi:hypothetical protein
MARASLHTTRTVKVLTVVVAMSLLGLGMLQTRAEAPATPEFERTWARTDKPVADLQVNRTWMWGPEANTVARQERYEESPGKLRTVQYYDKSRMEITHPDAVDDGVWFVTNGLLVNELISGRVQIGDDLFEVRQPAADINVAGDPDDIYGPTYGTIAMVVDEPPLADGEAVIQRLSRDGVITVDSTLAEEGVTAAYRVQVTGIDHQVASPFWEFMTAEGTVYEDGEFVDDLLFQNAFYATGFPITEAYWASVKLENVVQDVLIQCFERRCLTYTPGNDEGWQVEAGNVGQHYYRWRYPDAATPTPTETTTATATATATATGTVTATATATATTPPAPIVDEQLLIARLEGVTAAIDGEGRAYFHVSEDGTVSYQVVVTGVVNVTGAHIHAGGAGTFGEILVTLFEANDGTSVTPNGVLVDGTFNSDALPDDLSIVELVELMAEGQASVDVHTLDSPTGALRGQTQPLESINLRASLSGANVVPPVLTDANGAALLTYHGEQETVSYQIAMQQVMGLSSVQIRQGAANENGPTLATVFSVSPPIGSFNDVLSGTIDEDALADGLTIKRLVYLMVTGDTYLSVQTAFNPNGVLRGQIGVSAAAT